MIWQFVTHAASTQGICMDMYKIQTVVQGIKPICFQQDVIENCLFKLLHIYSLKKDEA